MTIEEIVECDSKKLESFTHAQLEEWFKPFFPTTRPELVRAAQAAEQKISIKQNTGTRLVKELSNDAKLALAKMAADGIDISFINRKGKR